MSLASHFEGFAGTIGGSFYRSPAFSDPKKPAGATPVEFEANWWHVYVNGRLLLFTPNFVWLAIAALTWLFFPYSHDIAAGGVSRLVFAKRAIVNCALVLVFFGWWHVTLYVLGWGKRPFQERRTYNVFRVAHNVWYSLMGALLWTCFEMALIHGYAKGRLEAAPLTWANVVVWAHLGVMIRDVHFYFAHRFEHQRFIYNLVHSLHHRNVDTEPFSGLCMHTAEHLQYFSCAVLPVMVGAPMFAPFWVGMHCLLSPAAAHSGFEDNFQSDQYHYIHHAVQSCNYGIISVPWDLWFGTARKVVPQQQQQQSVGALDAKARLGIPSVRAAVFTAACVACYVCWS